VKNVKHLYGTLNDIPWERDIDPSGYVSVTSVADTPHIANSRFLNQTCKDAVADRMVSCCGRRPDSGSERKATVLHCYWKDETFSLYFDTSGEPLSRRGYRLVSTAAPLQEALAAALIFASGWSKEEHFVNPMCGSGTFAIEAALMALEKPPGLLRDNFGFMHIMGYKAMDWKKLRNSINRKVETSAAIRIIATDIDERALEAARENARAAGVEGYIEFSLCSFERTEVPSGRCLVMMNPEYGKRMGEQRQLEPVYKGIGDYLKQKCVGCRAAVFTGNLEMAKRIGLRTSRRMTFFNGPIECRLLCYELYEGTRKKMGSRYERA
ncbi:MAG: class I SAM-dependent RNA methyltransferase, partial [Syntrophales bacterium]|nr:class I SAM-dependent RNA methyltransferase [Syntrophales bacterium]